MKAVNNDLTQALNEVLNPIYKDFGITQPFTFSYDEETKEFISNESYDAELDSTHLVIRMNRNKGTVLFLYPALPHENNKEEIIGYIELTNSKFTLI